MNKVMKEVDVLITPSYGGNQMLITNLTGHPCVVLPNGFNDRGSPTSFSIVGKLFDEASILRLAKAYQDKTKFTKIHSELFFH